MGHFPSTGHIARTRNMAQSGNFDGLRVLSWTTGAEVAAATPTPNDTLRTAAVGEPQSSETSSPS